LRKLFKTSDEKNAQRFANYLNSIKIECELRPEEDIPEGEESEWGFWLYNEDQISQASELKSEFLGDPFNNKFDVKAKKIKEVKAPVAKGAKYVDVRSEIFQASEHKSFPVSSAVMFLCGILYVASLSESYANVTKWLYYSQFVGKSFPEISNGQVWRIITPIFMHGGFFHVLFNLLWFHQLGRQIEKNIGSVKFLLFILAVGALVNTSQYLVSGANFVGLSGVVYALLGYIWVFSKYKYNARYELPDQTMFLMMVWLVLCFFMPNVANTQHVVGLLSGAGLGFLAAKLGKK